MRKLRPEPLNNWRLYYSLQKENHNENPCTRPWHSAHSTNDLVISYHVTNHLQNLVFPIVQVVSASMSQEQAWLTGDLWLGPLRLHSGDARGCSHLRAGLWQTSGPADAFLHIWASQRVPAILGVSRQESWSLKPQ